MLKRGVPQGSVLGPILYTLFTSPVGDISRSHNVGYHGFADDTQNYHSFTLGKSGEEEKCKQEIELCISDIRTWMRTNLLKLNDEKTEFLIIGTKQQLNKVPAGIAQLVEQRTVMRQVLGSIPTQNLAGG